MGCGSAHCGGCRLRHSVGTPRLPCNAAIGEKAAVRQGIEGWTKAVPPFIGTFMSVPIKAFFTIRCGFKFLLLLLLLLLLAKGNKP